MLGKALLNNKIQSLLYTTCLVHTLSSRNLPMLKGAYKSYVEVRKKKFKYFFLLLYEEIQWPLNYYVQNSNFILEFFISDFDMSCTF
jgi:hypothetical protein